MIIFAKIITKNMNTNQVNPAQEREYFLLRLSETRQGTIDEKKSFLNDLFTNRIQYISLMTEEDVQWIKPLAFDMFLPAIIILIHGMHYKLEFFDEIINDKETYEERFVEKTKFVNQQSVFTTDNTMENELLEKIKSQAPNMDSDVLHHFHIAFLNVYFSSKDNRYRGLCDYIDNVFIDRIRDLKKAYIHIAYLLRAGKEKNGFFVNYNLAKYYYDLAGVKGDVYIDGNKEYDPYENERINKEEDKNNVAQEVIYIIEGNDAKELKLFLEESYSLLEQKEDSSSHIPLELIMQRLVDTNAYHGYVYDIEMLSDNKLHFIAGFSGCDIQCLKYAIFQKFKEVYITIYVP